jgi:DNA-binding LytR/AlgR family response regulator
MKVVIIEDEAPAAERIAKLLLEISGEIEITKVLTGFKESLTWFQQNDGPDLILMDIELGDGLSIELVKQIKINCPIIFITAYDDYWQEAFEANGIDYLLKPLRKERLEAALAKLKELKKYFLSRMQDLSSYQASKDEKKYKDKFLIKKGNKFFSIKSDDVAFFYASNKMTFLVNKEASKYIVDQPLSEIRKLLNPDSFFRINRKYLANISAITHMQALPKSKLLIQLSPPVLDELIISSENSAEFKKWMNQ